jgi:hypothetical protein
VVEVEASELVRLEWRNRVEAEYRSAAITSNLVLWLLQLAVSPDLVRDGLQVVDDELEHAALSHATYVAAGGREPPHIDRAHLGLRGPESGQLEQAALIATVRVFCLGETVAVPLFRHLRSGCVQPTARDALDRILLDEARHSAFGWQLLDAFVERWGEDWVEQTVGPQLPTMLTELDTSYGRGATERDRGPVTDDERAWGVVSPREYEPLLHSTLANQWIPRFEIIGIDVSSAWELSSRRDCR